MAKRTKDLLPRELAAFFGQLSFIVHAGISLEEGLSMMAEEADDALRARVYKSVYDSVYIGDALSLALEKSGFFPEYAIQMIRIGEESGRMDNVLGALSDYYEGRAALNDSIKTAVTYPSIIIGMMTIVILILVIKVLPIFNNIFQQLGGEMSGIAVQIMNFGAAVGNSSLYILIALLVICAAVLIMRTTKKGSELLRNFYQRLFRKTFRYISAGRFASAMAMMLSSGLDIDRAVEMSYELVDDAYMKKKIRQLQVLIESGLPFAEAIIKADIFTGLQAHMISIGFKSGAIDTVMHTIAEQYEVEVENRINSLVSIIEPTLVAILSIIIGLILLSVMLPLMGIMSTIG